MSALYITANHQPIEGPHGVPQVLASLIETANRTGLEVRDAVNGVPCHIGPGADPFDVVQQWRRIADNPNGAGVVRAPAFGVLEATRFAFELTARGRTLDKQGAKPRLCGYLIIPPSGTPADWYLNFVADEDAGFRSVPLYADPQSSDQIAHAIEVDRRAAGDA